MGIVLLWIFTVKKYQAPCKCLSIIMLDFVIEAKKKYYPQTLLEECKYEQERIKIENLIAIMMNPMNNLLKVKKVF